MGKQKHGMRIGSRTRIPEYDIWTAMNQRCSNPKVRSWDRYGGRGIRVCSDWRNSFEAFMSDMGTRPSSAHSLDRIDNDGHYESGNVRWATGKQQNRNRASNFVIKNDGHSKTLAEWAEITGIPALTIRARIIQLGWPIKRALELPVKTKSRSGRRAITWNGETLCIAEWARRVGISPKTLKTRIFELGWPVENALTMPVRRRG